MKESISSYALIEKAQQVMINVPDVSSIRMFIEGARFAEYLTKKRINNCKPHVAEVVKCGDVNKKNTTTSYPKMLYPEYLPKEFQPKSQKGKAIYYETEVTKSCDHKSLHAREYNHIGFSCAKCGQWINTQND